MEFLWNFSGDRSRVCKIINFWKKQAYYEILFCFLSFDWRNFISSPLLRHPWFQYKYARLALRWKCLVWYPTQLQYPHHCTSACTHTIDSVSHSTTRARCFCVIHLERQMLQAQRPFFSCQLLLHERIRRESMSACRLRFPQSCRKRSGHLPRERHCRDALYLEVQKWRGAQLVATAPRSAGDAHVHRGWQMVWSKRRIVGMRGASRRAGL